MVTTWCLRWSLPHSPIPFLWYSKPFPATVQNSRRLFSSQPAYWDGTKRRLLHCNLLHNYQFKCCNEKSIGDYFTFPDNWWITLLFLIIENTSKTRHVRPKRSSLPVSRPLQQSSSSSFCLALVLGATFKLHSMTSVVVRAVAGAGCMNSAYKKHLNSLLLTFYVGRKDVFVSPRLHIGLWGVNCACDFAWSFELTTTHTLCRDWMSLGLLGKSVMNDICLSMRLWQCL